MTRASLLRAFTGLIFLLYPFLIYLGLHEFQPRVIASLLLVAAVLRLISNKYAEKKKKELEISSYAIAAAILVTIFIFATDLKFALYLYPLLVNLIFFTFFSISLFYPPTIIERIARQRLPDLPVKGVVYTRRVTQAWCVFFLINGGVSVMSIFHSEEWWVLYNGFIAYILIGLMLAGEYFIRPRFIDEGND